MQNARGVKRAERADRRSLNIPRDTIEPRDHMVANMKHDFGQDEQKVA